VRKYIRYLHRLRDTVRDVGHEGMGRSLMVRFNYFSLGTGHSCQDKWPLIFTVSICL